MVRTGLELLVHEQTSLLANQRVGLVSMPAAVLPDLTSSFDALRDAGIKVTALFGPEHGFGGAALDGAHIRDTTDPRTGLPIYSLYGTLNEPTAEMLANVDTVVFDMQDVGVRFYTYLSTLFYVLRGAHKADKPVVVLDRPNPITGSRIEGAPVAPGYESFVGIISLPIRHGMTLGELARYMNEEYALHADVRVIEMQGWQREMWFDQTDLPWVPTSPAMPHLSTAMLYPGMCLLEGTNLSLGRGTALPFEVCGAPWLDSYDLASTLNQLCLPGVRFRPTVFTPSASTHAGNQCYGVQVHVTDRDLLQPVEMALHLIALTRQMSRDDWMWNSHFERLAGSSGVRSALEAGTSVSEVLASWEESISAFIQRREKYLLYG
jgi:beta-N-acetylhexosaminidase